MKVTTNAIKDKIIGDKFGKRGKDVNDYGVPSRSWDIEISDVPEETVSYALVLEDKDAIPVCGFSWIHWVAANIKKNRLEENESINGKDFIQGINSWFGTYGKDGSIGYGGMTPPNAPHMYELHVYALDKDVELQNGFFMNELYHEMHGHILDSCTITGTYSN